MSGEFLLGDDAVALHFFRQLRLRDRDAILHQHLRLVEIGAELEGDGDGELAIRGRLAVDVQHVLDAVDLLLDRERRRCPDTVCAEAPGYCVVTTTVGGTTSGYSETGSVW